MIIIAEGMDNTGKTTMLKALASHLAVNEIIKSPGPSEGVDQRSWLHDQLLMDDIEPRETKIYDRFPIISEEVYGSLLREGSVFKKDWFIWWELLRRASPLVIYCRPSLEAIHQTMHDREQMEGVAPNVEPLLVQYDQLWKFMISYFNEGSLIAFDWEDDPSYQHLIRRVDSALRRKAIW